MKFSLLTYNLLFNRATAKLQEMLAQERPDLLFFQELVTNENEQQKIESLGYKLADFSNSFIRFGRVFGVATFYNPKTFSLVSSQSFDLPSSLMEVFLFVLRRGELARTVLKTEFEHKTTKKRIVAYNIHLSSFATNNVRKRQISNTLADLKLDKKKPLLIAGDFNYPYRRKAFEDLFIKYRLKEATKDIVFTSRFLKISALKLKLDYILYKNVSLLNTQRIDIKLSDHYPIMSTFSLSRQV